MDKVDIYIGLGSNLNKPQQQIRDAFNEIKNVAGIDVVKKSSLYKSPPLGPQEQPDYINAVINIQCVLPALEILDVLQDLEQKHKRIRNIKWGARTLDLDILLYGDHTIESTRLKIPHPGLYDRAFVLYPLFEIEPELILPNGVNIAAHVDSLGKQDIVKLI